VTKQKNSMTKTEFMVGAYVVSMEVSKVMLNSQASVVRRAAATVLPTPDAVELYIALFSQKLDALSMHL